MQSTQQRRISSWAVLGIISLGCPFTLSSRAWGSVVAIGPNHDSTIYSESSNSNGKGVSIYSGENSSGALRHGLISFNIATAGIPAGSTINSVTLKMVLDTVGGQGGMGGGDTTPRVTGLHLLQNSWVEGTSAGTGSGAAVVGTEHPATWAANSLGVSTWTTAGGDYLSTARQTATVGIVVNTPYTWASNASLVSDVQSWLNTPAGNFGWLVKGEETTTQTLRSFKSSDNATVADRPLLTIDYTAAPEPSSILLLGFGAAALLISRWRKWVTG